MWSVALESIIQGDCEGLWGVCDKREKYCGSWKTLKTEWIKEYGRGILYTGGGPTLLARCEDWLPEGGYERPEVEIKDKSFWDCSWVNESCGMLLVASPWTIAAPSTRLAEVVFLLQEFAALLWLDLQPGGYPCSSKHLSSVCPSLLHQLQIKCFLLLLLNWGFLWYYCWDLWIALAWLVKIVESTTTLWSKLARLDFCFSAWSTMEKTLLMEGNGSINSIWPLIETKLSFRPLRNFTT